MKRARKPPKSWRRNMVGAAALLAVLDGAILSATPDATRVALALVVTLLVGGSIVTIWRSNTRIEREAAEPGTGKSGQGPGAGKRPSSKGH